MRDGSPDWLLLKRGDVWTNESFGRWSTSGRGVQEPQVVASYGSGPRPLIKTNSNGLMALGTGTTDYVSFIGIHFYDYMHDYDSPDFVSGAGNYSAIDWLEAGQHILFENLVVEGYTMGVVIQNRNGTVTEKISIRRSIVIDNYAQGTFSHGFFFYGLRDVLVEENVIDHNGWASSRDASYGGATILNHNMYVQNVYNSGFVVRGNIFTRASATGIQLRPGGTLENNLFVRNPITMIIGYPLDDPWSTYPNGVDSIVRNNVILEGNDTNSTTPRGMAIQIADISSNITSGNIIAHDISDPVNTRGLHIVGTSDDPSRNITLRQNIFYKWYRGGPWIPNSQYVAISSETNNYYSEFSPITGSNFDSAAINWVDPNRTMATYNSSLGGANSFDAFIAEARKQSKRSWRPEYTAAAANDYIRSGFVQS